MEVDGMAPKGSRNPKTKQVVFTALPRDSDLLLPSDEHLHPNLRSPTGLQKVT